LPSIAVTLKVRSLVSNYALASKTSSLIIEDSLSNKALTKTALFDHSVGTQSAINLVILDDQLNSMLFN
jgi:hypothetical protein